MSWRFFVALAAAALGLTLTAGASAYPALATADGTAAELANPSAALHQVAQPLTVESYDLKLIPADPVAEHNTPPGNFKSTLWGYEAGFPGSRILQYDIGPTGTGPLTAGPTCVPTHTAGATTSLNGRGIAFDPLDGNLWNTHVALFAGDGFIHKNTPPPACTPVKSLPFAEGPGPPTQDDIGSLDVDEGTKHLWAAGYQPVAVGTPPVLLSFIYKVNRNNGKLIDSCAVPFQGGGVGNETLAAARLSGLPGSGKYLITDAGEPITVPNDYVVIDQAACHGGAVVTPVATFAKTTPGGVTGIDLEWPGLLASSLFALSNHDGPPFAAFTPVGAYGNTVQMEDISLCAFRSKIGGDGNDMCPY